MTNQDTSRQIEVAKSLQWICSDLILLCPPQWEEKVRAKILPAMLIATALTARKMVKDHVRAEPSGPGVLFDIGRIGNWMSLIPENRIIIRRIVWARSFVHPETGAPLFPISLLRKEFNCTPRTVARWHTTGLAMIAAALTERGHVWGKADD